MIHTPSWIITAHKIPNVSRKGTSMSYAGTKAQINLLVHVIWSVSSLPTYKHISYCRIDRRMQVLTRCAFWSGPFLYTWHKGCFFSFKYYPIFTKIISYFMYFSDYDNNVVLHNIRRWRHTHPESTATFLHHFADGCYIQDGVKSKFTKDSLSHTPGKFAVI